MIVEEAGRCCYELKQYKTGQDWFTKDTTLENWECFWEGLGLSFGMQKKYTEALIAFEKALALDTEYHYAFYYHNMIAECYNNLKGFYRALHQKPRRQAHLPKVAARYGCPLL